MVDVTCKDRALIINMSVSSVIYYYLMNIQSKCHECFSWFEMYGCAPTKRATLIFQGKTLF